MSTAANERWGTVLDALPDALFRVGCDDGTRVLASMSAAMRRTAVRLIPGDRVALELSSNDPSRGRIMERRTGP